MNLSAGVTFPMGVDVGLSTLMLSRSESRGSRLKMKQPDFILNLNRHSSDQPNPKLHASNNYIFLKTCWQKPTLRLESCIEIQKDLG